MSRRQWATTNYQQTDQRRNEDLENLFVFGYQCKLFRDDEKALFIDQGRHLIPWMGDSTLMIDRYDGRGHLFDLKPYVGGTNSEEAFLSEEEKHIEALCDEERYFELHTDIAEKAMYEEEELKRLNEALQENDYGAVGFNYDHSYDPAEPTDEEKVASTEPEEVELEEPFVPSEDLQLRPSMPVPKTVKQNTIIEKTAWFVCQHGGQMEIVVKTKQKNNPQFSFLEFGDDLNSYYKHILTLMKRGRYRPKTTQEKAQETTSSQSTYLHPSLAVNTASSTTAAAPEPLSPTGFLQSVQAKLPSGQLQNSVYASLVSKMAKHTAPSRESPTPTKTPAPKPSAPATVTAPSQSQSNLPPPPGPPSIEQSTMYMGMEGMPPPPGLEPVTLPYGGYGGQPPPPGTVPAQLPRQPFGPPPPPPVIEYGHRPPGPPEEEPEPPKFHGPAIIPPPPDIEPIIDKMASYVARNGPEFEMTVRNKGDPRFAFLHSTHIHFGYYDYKKQHYLEILEQEKDKEVDLGAQGKGLSFSIKTKNQKETNVLDKKRSVLPQEDSDDEEGEGSNPMTPTQRQEASNASSSTTDVEDSRDQEKQPVSAEQLEKKIAQEKLKDKLAVAARDKLAQTSKEKQLQAERKRKAAMFINMLKSTANSDGASASVGTVKTGSPAADTMTPGGSPFAVRPESPVSAQAKASSPVRRFSPSRVLQAGKAAIEKRRSRSRSPKRRRSKSPKHRKDKMPPSRYGARSRSRSPHRSKRRSKSRSPRKSSKSKSSRHKKRSRSSSKSRSHKKKRSRSRSPRRKHSKDKDRHRKDRSSRHSTKVSPVKASPLRLSPSATNDQENEEVSEQLDQSMEGSVEEIFPPPAVEINGSSDDAKNVAECLGGILEGETRLDSEPGSPALSTEGSITSSRSKTVTPDRELGNAPSEHLRSRIREMLKTMKEAPS